MIPFIWTTQEIYFYKDKMPLDLWRKNWWCLLMSAWYLLLRLSGVPDLVNLATQQQHHWPMFVLSVLLSSVCWSCPHTSFYHGCKVALTVPRIQAWQFPGEERAVSFPFILSAKKPNQTKQKQNKNIPWGSFSRLSITPDCITLPFSN